MCVVYLALGAHPGTRVLLAANRDEVHARPTLPAHRWAEPSPPGVPLLGGLDELAGGTWFGVSEDGRRWAAVTNVRDRAAVQSAQKGEQAARSRGELPRGFLLSSEGPEAYARRAHEEREAYAGFNLIVGEGAEAWYASSHTPEALALEPGVYGLSNATLGVRWPKVSRGLRLFRRRLGDDPDDPSLLLDLLADEERPGDGALPDTGVGLEMERFLSPIFIRGEAYGTRSSLVFRIDDDGRGLYAEKRYGPGGAPVETRLFCLGSGLRVPS